MQLSSRNKIGPLASTPSDLLVKFLLHVSVVDLMKCWRIKTRYLNCQKDNWLNGKIWRLLIDWHQAGKKFVVTCHKGVMSIWIYDFGISIEQLIQQKYLSIQRTLVLKGMDIYHQITDDVGTRMNFSLTFWRQYGEQPEIQCFSQHAYI